MENEKKPTAAAPGAANKKKYYKPRRKKTAEQPAPAPASAPAAVEVKNSQSKPHPGRRPKKSGSNAGGSQTERLKVIPLGGLDEVGKNMTVVEYGEDIIVVDAGLAFPSTEMPGVDLVIPDITYLEMNKEKIKGILITHGHEDHIGAIPYLLKKLTPPIFGPNLALGLIKVKLEEHRLTNVAKMTPVKAGEVIKLGCFSVEFIHTNHSIPDTVGLSITTPVGVLVFTGDFKIDSSPIQGDMIDLCRFGEIGKEGVLALFSDSTNAERPGFTMSEKTVGATLLNLFKNTDKRILVATFASNIFRVQQIIDAAIECGRYVAVSGRSMLNYMKVATELGIMNIPDGVMIDLNLITRYPKNKLVLITTGSQGEPMSALSRMAMSEHRKVEIGSDDMVIISASPIPGNEKAVSRVVNELLKQGAEVIYERLRDIHVSGHACQEELKLMLALIKPKYFVPVHGEYRQLSKHAGLAKQLGYEDERIKMLGIGKVLELSKTEARINGSVPSGVVMVDGLGIGDVGSIVLKDRKRLSEDGLIVAVATVDSSGAVITGPDLVSRGFVYVREAEDLMEEARVILKNVLEKYENTPKRDRQVMKTDMRDELSAFMFAKTRRTPMILPIIMDA